MAVVRARSAPPYGAFVGFFLFGVATIAAVGCYFMYAKSADDIRSATSAADAKQLALQKANAEKADLEKQIDDLKKARDLAVNNYNGSKSAITEAQARAETERKAAEGSSQALATAKGTFDKTAKDLSDRNTKLEADVAKANAALAAAVKQAEEDRAKLEQLAEDRSRETQLKLDQATSDLAKKDAEIADLKIRLGIGARDPRVAVNAGEADSRIAHVNQASGEATILLGKKDRVVPGMTFTAYDPRLGVRYGNDEAAMGNGSLEVIEVGETTSLCRITRVTPNHAIQANDLVANIVYHADRTRQFRFVIRGDFDLDGDGVATAAERERLERLITSWGGRVDTNVTSQTDYVVMGERPRSVASIEEAKPEGAAATAPQPGSVADQRQKDQQNYDDVIAEAVHLSIPVLNKNRFLAMIGYYNTSIVRYGAAK